MKLSKMLEFFLVIAIFLLGFGSKAFVVANLGDLNLIGPDPYLFYRYAKNLYDYGKIITPDCLRYYPLCSSIDPYTLIAYFGYINAVLMGNPLYYSIIMFLLRIFNVVPAATSLFDLGIHTTVPLLFGISAIIFYFLARVIFEDKIKAFLLSLFFIASPAITFRVAIFEKEAAATPFILLSLLFYVLAIKYPKRSELFYILSGLFTIVAMKAWGGWIIIPIVVGFYELARFILDKPKPTFVLSLIYIPAGILLFNADPVSYLLSFKFLLIETAIALHIMHYLFNKFNLYEKISYIESLSKLLKLDLETTRKIFLILILFIIALPIIIDKIWFLLSNPWQTRFGSSVAEQQPSTPKEYLATLTDIGFVLSLFGVWYLLYKWKKDLKNAALSFVLTILFFYIVVLSGTHIIFSWLVFSIIMLYIVYMRQHKGIDLFILVFSMITFVLGDYINRLIFYVGYSMPILAGYSLDMFKELLQRFKVKTLNVLNREINVLEILILLLLISSSLSAIHIFITTKQWPFLIPFVGTILFIIWSYILNKGIDLYKVFKYALSMVILFGMPSVTYGFFIHFFDSSAMGGTEWYLLDAMTWIKNNTPEDSIISFWWDYGYYAQTIANRTTWLDGGNAIVYWNHLMGRYGLCGNETEALELIYVHSTYNFNTYKILELFDRNIIFYKIYKKLNLTEEDLNVINTLKERLGEQYISLLFDIGKISYEELANKYKLSVKEVNVLKKLANISYTRPAYYLIHPTDIGKFYQFSKIGSDDYYDKFSWIVPFASVYILSEEQYRNLPPIPNVAKSIGDKFVVTFADKDTLIFTGGFLLDEDLKINGTKIPRCNPELGLMNCGIIFRVDIKFSEQFVEYKGLNPTLNINKLLNSVIKSAYVYVSYNNKVYKLKLGCVYFDGVKYSFKDAEYNGCLYITPSINLLINNIPEGAFARAFFISQKAMNYIWIKLYFFEEGKYFKKVYDSMERITGSSIITAEQQPLKVWRINFPENFTVPEYKYCLYLAKNLADINKCAKIYNLKPFSSIWQV